MRIWLGLFLLSGCDFSFKESSPDPCPDNAVEGTSTLFGNPVSSCACPLNIDIFNLTIQGKACTQPALTCTSKSFPLYNTCTCTSDKHWSCMPPDMSMPDSPDLSEPFDSDGGNRD